MSLAASSARMGDPNLNAARRTRPDPHMTARFDKRMGLKLAVAAVAAIATTAIAPVARAEEPRGVDWMKALVDLDRVARGGPVDADRSTAASQRQSVRGTS